MSLFHLFIFLLSLSLSPTRRHFLFKLSRRAGALVCWLCSRGRGFESRRSILDGHFYIDLLLKLYCLFEKDRK